MASSVSNSLSRRRSSSVALSDAVEACVQQCCSLVTGHRPVAAEGAVGVTSDAAVLLNQVAERLIGPVGWVNVGRVRRDVRNAIDVELSSIGGSDLEISRRGENA